ncbi:hypothetical protein BDY19DRAFT_257110 [Irpex rosettiformis]|uniref:Uncharacterized protein n=1 Tax=Irpex rosettiformis TaxID=378272 RepID=A0ACB8UIK4_9APHY|nr:hypothetical protein BDY19DRAFT_257110 [Irpex rosettiformis]
MPVQRTRPLQDYPQFSVYHYEGRREYRVENWRLARDGSRRIIKSYGWTWFDLAVPVLVAVLWPKLTTRTHYIVLLISLACYIYTKCTQILWESVHAVPYMGIQLETHRGLPNIPLFVSRRFIPAIYLRDVIISEALRGWTVRYYLAAIQEEDGRTTLQVAYENILPYFPVLLHVYRDVHAVMFTPMDSPS